MSRRTTNAGTTDHYFTQTSEVSKLIGPRQPPPFSLVEEPGGVRTLRDDLEAMGHTAREAEALSVMYERKVDSYAQIPHLKAREDRKRVETALADFLKKAERKRVVREGAIADEGGRGVYGRTGRGRQQVYIDREKKWVLFDPTRGWPPTMLSDAPAVYERYSRYEMGNDKIVAYNIESFAVTLRKTPKVFEAHSVVYQKAGPKLKKADRPRKVNGKGP